MEDPLDTLTEVTLEISELYVRQIELVQACRVNGATWEQIAVSLGMTRQGAWARFSVVAE